MTAVFLERLTDEELTSEIRAFVGDLRFELPDPVAWTRTGHGRFRVQDDRWSIPICSLGEHQPLRQEPYELEFTVRAANVEGRVYAVWSLGDRAVDREGRVIQLNEIPRHYAPVDHEPEQDHPRRENTPGWNEERKRRARTRERKCSTPRCGRTVLGGDWNFWLGRCPKCGR